MSRVTTPKSQRADELVRLWASTQGAGLSGTDYILITSSAGVHVALTRSGFASLVLEVDEIPASAVGRHSAGCELIPYPSLKFVLGGRSWDGAAAALVCTDQELHSVFSVLAADIEHRIGAGPKDWRSIVAAVEEWQSLLTSRGRPSVEMQVGLWGELWMIAACDTPDRLLSGWRGPDREVADFFLDGKSVEVKTSRHRRQHHVALDQVDSPRGQNESWLLSFWVGVEPIRGRSVPMLVDDLLSRVAEPIELLRRLERAGYGHADSVLYEARMVLLAEPEWYAVSDVPRIRSADEGVSRVRYVATLSEARAVSDGAPELWRHFTGSDYRSMTDETRQTAT